MPDVKRPSKRTERAQHTRRRIVEAAHDLFVEQGYVATLMPEIANRAGVAVQTIYFTFGNKRSLLKEVVDVVIAGDFEPIATMDRPWFQAALAADTAGEMLRAHVRGTCQVLERIAPISRVIEAASAADPEIADLWSFDADPRHTVQSAAATALVSKSGSRPGVTADHAADILFGLLSPELYRLFVREREWSSEAYEHWVYDTLRAQLCADDVEAGEPA
jgi:AcrR family transcriptional regulator